MALAEWVPCPGIACSMQGEMLLLGSGESGAEEAVVPLIAPLRAWFTGISVPWPPVGQHHKKRET